MTGLLRRLGLGLLTVSPRGHVVPVLDPAPYRPRTRAGHRGAPAQGVRRTGRGIQRTEAHPPGNDSQRTVRTRYDAHASSADQGVLKVSVLSERTGVSRTGPILRDNHYGWFDRVKTGHYALSPKGRRDVRQWPAALERRGSQAP